MLMNTPIPENLDELDANALRALLHQSRLKHIEQAEIIKNNDRVIQIREQQLSAANLDIRNKDLHISKLTHEIAYLRRIQFGKKSEQLAGEQYTLWQETVASDIAAIEDELKSLAPKPAPEPKLQPKRSPLPANLPRIDIHHEPHKTSCSCGCQLERVGEDISEKLDYTPGVFNVERHIRGKWVVSVQPIHLDRS